MLQLLMLTYSYSLTQLATMSNTEHHYFMMSITVLQQERPDRYQGVHYLYAVSAPHLILVVKIVKLFAIGLLILLQQLYQTTADNTLTQK